MFYSLTKQRVMLANLDNEIHFKKVFTDVEVFTAFVKDILGIDMHINKVETERVLLNKVSAIKFKLDLFAEDKETRTIVEVQKVDYDYTYDRFSHYFLANLIDVQRSSTDYSYDKEIYVIVVVTSAYKIIDKTGNPVKKDVIITDINPRDLNGQIISMTNHKMIILNPTYPQPDTPERISDWLDLIKESMKNPENPNINMNNPAIAKAAGLADFDRLSPEELAESKIDVMRRKAAAVRESQSKQEGREEAEAKAKLEKEQMILGMDKAGLPTSQIAIITQKTEDEVQQIIAKNK